MSTTTPVKCKPGPCYTRENRDLIRRGLKTMTRWIVTPQPLRVVSDWTEDVRPGDLVIYNGWPHRLAESRGRNKRDAGILTPVRKECPHGKPGDRLYLIEPLRLEYTTSDDDTPSGCMAVFRDDDAVVHVEGKPLEWRWQRNTLPQIHMPAVAARAFMDMEAVRVERLHDITEADAIAEGVTRPNYPDDWTHPQLTMCYPSAVEAYFALWEVINGVGAVALNPWLFAESFHLTPGAK